MRSQFPLFQSHLDLAHRYWKKIVQPGHHVIDATCGNGHDTLHLCEYALGEGGKVYAFDKLEEAVQKTQQKLSQVLSAQEITHVHFEARCHSTFPDIILPGSIQLIVYNLGYHPGGDKTATTVKETTLNSIQEALLLISPGGAISLTCYPGHPEGALEERELLDFVQTLSPSAWSCCHHAWLNRRQSPSLLLLQRAI